MRICNRTPQRLRAGDRTDAANRHVQQAASGARSHALVQKREPFPAPRRGRGVAALDNAWFARDATCAMARAQQRPRPAQVRLSGHQRRFNSHHRACKHGAIEHSHHIDRRKPGRKLHKRRERQATGNRQAGPAPAVFASAAAAACGPGLRVRLWHWYSHPHGSPSRAFCSGRKRPRTGDAAERGDKGCATHRRRCTRRRQFSPRGVERPG